MTTARKKKLCHAGRPAERPSTGTRPRQPTPLRGDPPGSEAPCGNDEESPLCVPSVFQQRTRPRAGFPSYSKSESPGETADPRGIGHFSRYLLEVTVVSYCLGHFTWRLSHRSQFALFNAADHYLLFNSLAYLSLLSRCFYYFFY